jgi:hypothetical protein
MKNKGHDYDECCYKEMTKSIGGQSQTQPYWNEPMQNEYEMNRKSNFDQSGMRKGK